MNQMTAFAGSTASMTSREIADLLESRHDSVKRAIERLVDRGTITNPPLVDYPNPAGKPGQEYRISKRDSYVIVAQLSPEFTARLVDRWQQLEAATPAPAQLSRMDLLQLALQSETERLALADKVAADAPKVEFAEAVRNMDGLCKLEQIAKTLGWGRNRFIDRLRADHVLQQDRAPYQKYIDADYFKVVEKMPWKDSQGNEHPSFVTMVTGKGQIWLTKRYAGVTA